MDIQLIKDFAKKEGFIFDETRLRLTRGTPENGDTIFLEDDGSVIHYCNGFNGFTEWIISGGEFKLI